jgi:MoxR-like ATPase
VANFSDDKSALDALRTQHEALLAEVGKVIVGQDAVIREVTTAIFAGGHILLVGVPGLAKTLLVNTVAQALGLSFNRIQFTPDLMPSDIVGAEILDESRQFKFVKGPLFSNIVLADEDDILAYQQVVRRMPVADNVVDYAVNLAASTRPGRDRATAEVNQYLSWGAGPRASQYLIVGAKVNAALNGKYSPDIEDVQAVALPILRHRIVRNYKAEADGITVEALIDRLK